MQNANEKSLVDQCQKFPKFLQQLADHNAINEGKRRIAVKKSILLYRGSAEVKSHCKIHLKNL